MSFFLWENTTAPCAGGAGDGECSHRAVGRVAVLPQSLRLRSGRRLFRVTGKHSVWRP